MQTITTTHVGSLPRSQDVADVLFAKERGEAVDGAAFDATMRDAVARVVRRQVEAGIDVVSDGEQSKISYATYVKDRFTGFEGDSPRSAPADLKLFPGFMERLARSGGTPTYARPRCTGAIRLKDAAPLAKDIANLKAAAEAAGARDAFMNAASPGVVALFQPNAYYKSHEAYLEALGEALAYEYRTIVEAGLILQIDCPDLALSRHMLFADRSDGDFVKIAETHLAVLNAALADVPAERCRLHICWGNYEGPHVCDIPMARMFDTLMRAKPRFVLFEGANPRHGHEWRVFVERRAEIPDDKVLVPGVIDTTTNFVEHPELVAERIERFADIVGVERVVAGTDCGFGTFAGFGAVDPEIAYAKLAALAEGARIASKHYGTIAA